MKKTLAILIAAGSLALAGCADMSRDQATTVGALAGAAGGLAVADALGSSGTGKAVGTLAGAAAGAAIGASSSAKQCRYPNGVIAACPAGY